MRDGMGTGHSPCLGPAGQCRAGRSGQPVERARPQQRDGLGGGPLVSEQPELVGQQRVDVRLGFGGRLVIRRQLDSAFPVVPLQFGFL